MFALTSLCAVGLAVVTIVACAQDPTGDESVTAAVHDPDEPERSTFGRLIFMAGFELELDEPGFGGLSGLDISDDGTQLVAVSDHGWWITGNLTHDDDGELVEIEGLGVQPMLDVDGEPLPERAQDAERWRDAEDIARARDSSFYVTFEREHRLWQYDDFGALPSVIELPAEVAQLRDNGGIESVTLLPDGRPLVLAEEAQNDDQVIDGWLLDSGAWRKIAYQGRDDFGPTAMASLEDGSIIVLERSPVEPAFVSIRLRQISPAMLFDEGPIDPPLLAAFGNSLLTDNFEGLAIRPSPDGGHFLYVVSDDSFALLRRTLLHQFHLPPP